MKKILLSVAVVLFAAANVNAQSFLKRIGKAVEKEIVNGLSGNKDKQQPAKEQQTNPTNQHQTQRPTTPQTSYRAPAPSSIKVPISEVYPGNAEFYSEGPTGATTTIDNIEYVVFTDKKYAYLSCVAQPMRGKTTRVRVWGGIRYKGVVYPVIYIKAHAFEGESLTSVQLPSTLQEIQEEAFSSSHLQSVVIPSSTWRIGASAFAGTPLTSVRMVEGVKQIEGSAFAGCMNLTQIAIPNSVTKIDRNTFQDCKKLTQVILSRNIKSIPVSMFEGCTALTSYSIPGNIEKIEANAFSRSGLTAVRIPLNVKTIEDSAFAWCSNLTSVTIPSTVEHFGDMIFVRCDKLSQLYIHKKHKDLRTMVNLFGSDCPLFTSDNMDEWQGVTWVD